ncbi:MAG: hypothetical protein ACFFCQ_17375 [Promethearchaeota archaeon]
MGKEVGQESWAFYRFNYENTDLAQLNESLEHWQTSLKGHL